MSKEQIMSVGNRPGEYKGFIIRERQLLDGWEWQVVQGKKILHRCDFNDQAKRWIDMTIKEERKSIP